jgi:iron(III) transport system permease protein
MSVATETPVPPELAPEPPRRPTGSLRLRLLSTTTILKVLLSAAVVILIGLPVIKLVVGSFREHGPLEGGPFTFHNYADTFTNPVTLELVRNTLIFAVGQTIVPLVLGVLLAWFVVRTNIPWKPVWEFATIGLYFIPLLVAATAWTILLGPNSGILNVAWRSLTGIGGFNVYSMAGMILIQSLYLVPLVYLVVGASFRSINPELEEASRTSGASPWSTFLRITLGVSRPAVLSAAVLCFIIGIGSMEIPLIFGFPGRVYVFTTNIYSALRVRFPPEYAAASALAVTLLVVAVLVLWLYLRLIRNSQRFVTVGGRGHRAATVDIGRWRWVAFGSCAFFFFFTILLPFLAVLLGSLLPYVGAPSRRLYSQVSLDNYRQLIGNEVFLRSVKNSLVLAVGAGIAVMIVGTLVAYLSVRDRSRWSRALDVGANLPLTVPGIVLATALLFTYISFRIGSYHLYGTLWLMGMAYLIYFLPVAVRQMTGPIIQLAPELEHASRVAGASQLATLRRVVFPLLLPAMGGGFLLAFITFIREFVNSILLFNPGNEVISVVMYSYYSNGSLPQVAAISVLMSLAVTVLLLLMSRVFKIRISF